MYTEASSPRQPGDTARLAFPVFRSTNPFCLSFYYHMYGSSMGTLNIYVNGLLVWHLSGDQGNQWKKAVIPVNRTYVNYHQVKQVLHEVSLIAVDRMDSENATLRLSGCYGRCDWQ